LPPRLRPLIFHGAAPAPRRACCARGLIALTLSGSPDPLSTARSGTPPDRDLSGVEPMSKEKNRGNREAKKPKKEKPKVLATANSNSGKTAPVIGGKAVK